MDRADARTPDEARDGAPGLRMRAALPTRSASGSRELRSQAQVSRPANEAFVAFMNEIEDKEQWEDTIERGRRDLSGD